MLLPMGLEESVEPATINSVPQAGQGEVWAPGTSLRSNIEAGQRRFEPGMQRLQPPLRIFEPHPQHPGTGTIGKTAKAPALQREGWQPCHRLFHRLGNGRKYCPPSSGFCQTTGWPVGARSRA